MAWDEQRRMRDPDGQDTAKIAGAPSGSSDAAPHPSGTGSDESGWEHWGQRFGWLVAVGLSVIALLISVIALSNAGSSDTGFRHGGRGMFGGPGYGYGGGSGTQSPPAFPDGQGDGKGFGSR